MSQLQHVYMSQDALEIESIWQLCAWNDGPFELRNLYPHFSELEPLHVEEDRTNGLLFADLFASCCGGKIILNVSVA